VYPHSGGEKITPDSLLYSEHAEIVHYQLGFKVPSFLYKNICTIVELFGKLQKLLDVTDKGLSCFWNG
jgi:hypothetical protein